MSLDDLLTDPAYAQDPYPALRRLRTEAPVHYCAPWGVWIVTRHEHVVAVLRNFESFSNAGRFGAFVSKAPVDVQHHLQAIVRHNSVGMLQSDPPIHTRLRRIVQRQFVPRSIADWEPLVERLVVSLLDKVRRQGSADLIGQLAFPLPFAVIGRLLGVPPGDEEMFATWATMISSFQATGRPDPELGRRSALGITEIESYFDDLCRQRRSIPQDDLISVLVAARDDDALSHGECINACVNLVLAGHETTRALIGNAVHIIWNRSSVLDQLRRDPSFAARAVEECLRFESPIQRGWRRVARPVRLGEQHLAEGDLVYMMLGSANRDESVFTDPDEFDLDRSTGAHVAFGLGPHFCLGAPLARLEATVLLREMVTRLPNLKIGVPKGWAPSIHVRTLVDLPATV